MARLPVITSFGGINGAGRGSGFHAYQRLIFDTLDKQQQLDTLQNLACLTGRLNYQQGSWHDDSGNAVELNAYLEKLQPQLLAATLIRKLEKEHFDSSSVPFHKKAQLNPVDGGDLEFSLREKDLPHPLPESWHVSASANGDSGTVNVRVVEKLNVMLPSNRTSEVNCAGQLPTGFNPADCYNSRNHPRALQLTVFGASDAIQSMGVDWEMLRQLVPADQISVYAGSCLSQLDYNGYGGMLQARLLGKKVSSKQLPLGLNEMPADFINAYLLGSLGTTGHNNGACATFLYNLRQGIRDIRAGSHRVAIIGTSESALVPEVMDAFTTMGALASDASLCELEKLLPGTEPDFRRACRPFGANSGFTLAESAQFIVLFDDELALQTGAEIYGAVNDVFVNADGHKKSITGPGLGNYLTMAKAAAATRNIIGEKRLQHASFVQAHGTGTPQNRVTESAIINKIAETFGIEQWPVAAVKSYLGHSVASAAGDQILASLGIWKRGVIPGILTVDKLAEDVENSHLDILLQHKAIEPFSMDAALINSKGFGGNNASASLLAPHVAQRMLEKRHGKKSLADYQKRNEAVRENIADYNQATNRGDNRTIYKFDHEVLGSSALNMNSKQVEIDGLQQAINLELDNPFADMCD